MSSSPFTPTRKEFFEHGIERVSADELSAAQATPNGPDGTTQCVICLEVYGQGKSPERPLRVLQCGHWFGSECIEQLASNQCPLCRARLWRLEAPADDEDNEGDDDDSDADSFNEEDHLETLSREQTAPYLALSRASGHARTPFEALASARALDLAWFRCLATYDMQTDVPLTTLASPPPLPHASGSGPRDPRPYLHMPAFEAVLLRDVVRNPLHHVDLLRLGGGGGAQHVWLSVRADAVDANFESAVDGFVNMLQLPAHLPVDDVPGFVDVERAAGAAREAVVAWCRVHEAELWRVEDLVEAWRQVAAEAMGRVVAGRALERAEEAVRRVLAWLVYWRAVREVEVYGGLLAGRRAGDE